MSERTPPPPGAPGRERLPGAGPRAASVPEHSIIVGEVFASRSPAEVTTLLGSCVAACLFDPLSGIGGMNHFMLPESTRGANAATYGVHAMELLINKIMQLGGDRRSLQAKVFGGANVLALRGRNLQIGRRNAEFALQFLADEGITVMGKRLGGQTGVKLCFLTHSGKAFVKPLPNTLLSRALQEEVRYLHREPSADPAGAVTFF